MRQDDTGERSKEQTKKQNLFRCFIALNNTSNGNMPVDRLTLIYLLATKVISVHSTARLKSFSNYSKISGWRTRIPSCSPLPSSFSLIALTASINHVAYSHCEMNNQVMKINSQVIAYLNQSLVFPDTTTQGYELIACCFPPRSSPQLKNFMALKYLSKTKSFCPHITQNGEKKKAIYT